MSRRWPPLPISLDVPALIALRLGRSTLAALPDGVAAPGFDVARVTPGIVHIGLGGFHRAHMARYTHDLMALSADALGWGIVGAGLQPGDAALCATLNEQDGLYTLLERDGDDEQASVIGSIAGAIDASAWSAALLDAIADPGIRIVSLTVTEHGYCLDRATKRLALDGDAIRHDLAHRHDPRTAIGVLVEAWRRRRDAGLRAFTAMSCDNIQHNGAVLAAAVRDYAMACDPALAAWIDANATFPNTMVDRITPVPTPADADRFAARHGLVDRAVLPCEAFRQWVIEDRFADGRPDWDRAGAQFVADVTPYEVMKLRLLNASHLAISGLGKLAGHETIDAAIGDPLIRRAMIALMDRETGPTLAPVPGIDLAAYKVAVVARFANRAIRDTVDRVNADAPLNYLLDPLRDRLASGDDIALLALALAAWLRRVRGEDEAGRRIAVIHPLADLLRAKAIEGGPDPRPLLSIAALFGDLGEDSRVHDATTDWLASLYDRGVQATLRRAADSGII